MENESDSHLKMLNEMKRYWTGIARFCAPVDAHIVLDISQVIQILIDRISKYMEDQREYICYLARRDKRKIR